MIRPLLVLMIAASTAGCGSAGPQTRARPHLPSMLAARAVDEPALIRQLALEAHAALVKADAAYKAVGLNTAAGRKLTPKREPIVREALRPVVAELEATSAGIAARLAVEDGSAKLATLREAFASRPPVQGDALPAEAGATALLYRVAQLRLKLGFLVEYALRRGVVVELPPPNTPATPGEDPPGVDERAR